MREQLPARDTRRGSRWRQHCRGGGRSPRKRERVSATPSHWLSCRQITRSRAAGFAARQRSRWVGGGDGGGRPPRQRPPSPRSPARPRGPRGGGGREVLEGRCAGGVGRDPAEKRCLLADPAETQRLLSCPRSRSLSPSPHRGQSPRPQMRT